MKGLVRSRGARFSMAVDLPIPESEAERRFQNLVKAHIEATGDNPTMAEYAVALTPEGKAAWEEARKARLKRG